MATSTNTDFTMIELTNPPPAGSVFLGWDAQTNYQDTPNIDLYRVHHPSGEMQHVTKYWTNTTNTTCTARPRSRYIQMTRNIGFTTGGSSGSLIVNNKAQMVGQFYGGCGAAAVGSCDPNRIHVDGAFRISYPLVQEHLTPIPDTEAVYTFNLASGAWNFPASWDPPRDAPLSTDILMFDGTSASGANITVSSIPTQTIGRLMLVNGAQVVFEDGLSATTTLNINSAGESFSIEPGSSLELNNTSAGVIRIVLQPSATGTVEGDVIFAAQDDDANPRIISQEPGALVFESGATAAAAPGAGASTDSTITQRGGFGNATDGAVNGGVLFRSGSTWYQGGRKDGTRAGAESGGPHGLNTPNQAAHFERGSSYVVLRGGLATPRSYPTVIFRDDVGVRNVSHGALIDGDLIMAEPGGNGGGVGSLNINAFLDPAITVLGDVVVPAGTGVPAIVGTATPGSVSRAYISGDLIVGDPNKFPAGLNGRRWHFNGTAAQTVDFSGPKTLHRVAVENLNGVDFADDITLTGGLELTSGPLNMGNGTLYLGGVVVSTPVNGWIIGGVQRTFDPSNTSTTRILHIGTNGGAGWVRVTPLVAAGTAGELQVRSSDGVHPEAAALGAPFGRWWALSGAEGLDTTGGSFRISFDWQESDVPPGALPQLVRLVRFHNSALEVHEGAALTVDFATRRATLEGATELEGDWFLVSQEPLGMESWGLY